MQKVSVNSFMNSPAKKIYGLVGFPVKHSFSPAMHNAAFNHLNINAEYRLFELKESELEHFVKVRLKEENIRGFNVTIPYKEKILCLISGDLASGVEAIGAVNTVRRQDDGKLVGFNTDWAGFSKDLLERGVNTEGKKVCVLGAGGAARAVVYALREAEEIFIYDIDKVKCQKLVEDMYKDEDFEAIIEDVNGLKDLPLEECDILVNATPLGMKLDDKLIIEAERLNKMTFVYDCIYNPKETKLLQAAKHKGLKCANGLGMLLYQGVFAFQHWTHQDAPVEVMRRALTEQLK